MYFSDYSEEEKQQIARQVRNHTIETATKDYHKLTNLLLDKEKYANRKPLSPVGLTFIEYFIHAELLNTVSKQGIHFYDFWYHRDFYMHRDASTERLVASIQKNRPKLTEIKVAKQVYNLYYGGINIFRPLNAYHIYTLFPSCKRILDPTMGWGGRLLAAFLAEHVDAYIGIDCNLALKKPYEDMTHFLFERKPEYKDKIQLYFQDALSVDYSALSYDMVFTSPPFYNKEIYSHNAQYKTKEEWDTHFYVPLFTKTWVHLKAGGIYALNVPEILYTRVAAKCLGGEADEKIELAKYGRVLPKTTKKRTNVGQSYKEYIYIWIKK
jgi:hypothetical protein